ncbi:unnamed protein product [Didymodactylos carnosus]|uniref:Uncharacterized protein n=1 Tax=Didymodactylos carnosus TaxID=1234261 RepID=A0A8S2DXH3_9BILA|nr:unnamed protein product [Didymodactylos carnosus]CAF3827465.1 unnamed protein product [Didymodactylos carnosus]
MQYNARTVENQEEPRPAMLRLRIRDNDTYVPGGDATKNSKNHININQIMKTTDNDVRKIIILAECRNLDLVKLFSYEFTDAPLSLCDNDNFNLMNQQKKAAALDFLKEIFPSSFSRVCPITFDQCAVAQQLVRPLNHVPQPDAPPPAPQKQQRAPDEQQVMSAIPPPPGE